jgi:hypothetical protein
VLQGADSLMSRLQTGSGTIGLLTSDSSLYLETTKTVVEFRQLIKAIEADPKKYLKISVF